MGQKENKVPVVVSLRPSLFLSLSGSTVCLFLRIISSFFLDHHLCGDKAKSRRTDPHLEKRRVSCDLQFVSN